MLSSPLPEKAADFRYIGSAGNIFQGPIIDGHHGGSLKRFTLIISEFDLKDSVFSGPIRFLGRADLYIQNTFLRRHNNFTCLTVKPAVINGKCLNEKVGHVFICDGNLFHGTFAGHADNFRGQVNAVGRPDEQNHCSPRTIGIDQEPDTIPRGIFTIFRDQLYFGKSILSAVIPLTPHRENIAAFNAVILFILHPERQSILSGPGSL